MTQISVRPAAVVFHKGKLLAVKSRYSGTEYYLAPGGGIEGSETIFECAERECFEETGLRVKAWSVVCVNDYIARNGRCLNVFILSKLVGKNITPTPKTLDGGKIVSAEWLSLDKLSKLEFRPKRLLTVLKKFKTIKSCAAYFKDEERK